MKKFKMEPLSRLSYIYRSIANHVKKFPKKKVLVLEGGGMRGIFLTGVLQARLDGLPPEERMGMLSDLYTMAGVDGELDPAAAAKIEPTNRRRTVRALEVTVGSGRPPTEPLEEPGHHVNVPQVRNVAKHVVTVSEKSSSHDGQSSILGPAHRHAALQACSPDNSNVFHAAPCYPVAPTTATRASRGKPGSGKEHPQDEGRKAQQSDGQGPAGGGPQ